MEAFLADEGYATTCRGFRPDATPSDGAALPHGATRRYFNETLIASKAAGNRPATTGQHFTGSMVVKEILERTTVVGKAAMLRTDTSWVYYCLSSVEGRCFQGSVPNVASYATAAGSCACHGSGTIISHDAIPAP